MALTREQIGIRIRQLRDSLGFTQADVARGLGVHRPTVSEIEAGRRAVSSEELYRLAQLFAMPISAFLSDSEPSDQQVLGVLFRRDGPDSPWSKAAVLRFMQRCRDEQELEDVLRIPHEFSPRPGYRVQYPDSKMDAVQQGGRIAHEERQRLGLGDQPIRNPLALLEQQGVRIGPVTAIESDAIDGLYFESEELGACVGVNSRPNDVGGARAAFTAAHEYAHWLLRDIQVEFFEFSARAEDVLHEVRANAFAAAFLMPGEGVKRYFRDAGLLRQTGTIEHLSPGDVIRAMEYFGVSRAALLFRLLNLSLIRQLLAESLKDFSVQATANALEISFASHGLIGTRLPRLALHAWRLGVVSAGRAAALCDMDLATFKEFANQLGEFPDAYDGLEVVGASADA